MNIAAAGEANNVGHDQIEPPSTEKPEKPIDAEDAIASMMAKNQQQLDEQRRVVNAEDAIASVMTFEELRQAAARRRAQEQEKAEDNTKSNSDTKFEHVDPWQVTPLPEEKLFKYEREIWFISSFVNRNSYSDDQPYLGKWDRFFRFVENPVKFFKTDGRVSEEKENHMSPITGKLQKEIKRWIKGTKKADLKRLNDNTELQAKILDMKDSVHIHRVKWRDYVSFYPHAFLDQTRGLKFDTLGYFEVELEYYYQQSGMKKTIEPSMLQYIPYIVLKRLKESFRTNNQIFIDVESPVYVAIVASERTIPPVSWTKATIWEHRKQLGIWTECYSGHWPDYTDELYQDRVRDNLSSRSSELHYIRRNSALLYMRQENIWADFLEDRSEYMRKTFFKPIAEIRAMNFAIAAISDSVDTMFLLHRYHFQSLGERIENLQKTRGNLFNKMGRIYSQLERNNRTHYIRVVRFLLREFDFETTLERLNEKVNAFTDTLQLTYQKETQRVEERQDRKLNLVNVMLGLGVVADIASLLASSIESNRENPERNKVYISFLIPLITLFLIGFTRWIQLVLQEFYLRAIKYRFRAEAIILNSKKTKILLEDRQLPPFANYRCLPGGYIGKGEDAQTAVVRAMRDDWGLEASVKAVSKRAILHVPKYGRFRNVLQKYKSSKDDPRGSVVSYVFHCVLPDSQGEVDEVKSGLKHAKFYPLKDVLQQFDDMAFNHGQILNECVHKVHAVEYDVYWESGSKTERDVKARPKNSNQPTNDQKFKRVQSATYVSRSDPASPQDQSISTVSTWPVKSNSYNFYDSEEDGGSDVSQGVHNV